MTAIKGVSERLSDVDEVEMEGVSHSTSMSSTMSGPSSDDFSAKFSVQGTSSSKSTGKRKVVCIARVKNYMLIVIFFNSLFIF
jgi:RAC serine/threonine-protein kinase